MSKIAFVRSGGIYSDSRATKEIEALAGAGHSVMVIAWDRSGEAAAKCAAVFRAYADRVSFTFFSPNPKLGGRIENIAELFSWFEFIESTLKNHIHELDWVHACDLDAGWPACQVCEAFGKKLVYDIFDYFVDSRQLPSGIRDTVEKMELSVIRYADTTIICTEERREQIRQAEPQKVVVIHNSPDVAGIAPDLPERWHYAYCGALAEDRLVGEILRGYPRNQDLRFVYAGFGKYLELAEECAGAANFTYQGKIPYAQVLELESQSAVLSAIYRPTKRNHRLCAPNKFYEALALGKPVIVCRGTGIDKTVEEHELGAVIDYDADEFYRVLRTLLSDRDRRLEMGMRARSLYEAKYKWSLMKQRLIQIYGSA